MPQRLSASPLEQLIAHPPGMAAEGFETPLGWVYQKGAIPAAIAYGELFWPEFVLHDGCVLFAGFDPENYKQWFAQCKGNRRSIEGVMNHRHIVDFFAHARFVESAPTREQLIYLGRLLKEIWAVKARLDCPGLNITVAFDDASDLDDLDYILYAYQNPPA